MSDIKLCVDCRHYQANQHTRPGANLDKCKHPKLASVDFVRGEYQPTWCESNRSTSLACGREAKHWEPAEQLLTISATEASHVSEF